MKKHLAAPHRYSSTEEIDHDGDVYLAIGGRAPVQSIWWRLPSTTDGAQPPNHASSAPFLPAIPQMMPTQLPVDH